MITQWHAVGHGGKLGHLVGCACVLSLKHAIGHSNILANGKKSVVGPWGSQPRISKGKVSAISNSNPLTLPCPGRDAWSAPTEHA